MANNFCRFLSNGYRFETDGTSLTYSPCCWFNQKISIINNPNFNKQKEKISQINDWVPECISCQRIEESGAYGKKSPRLRSFDEIPNETIPNNVPVWVELSIDTTCNAACIMCGPNHSTTWRRQEIKFGVKSIHDLPDLVDPTNWWRVIKNQFPLDQVCSVSFLGGEPMESPIPLLFLQSLKESRGTLADVVVHFQTNGSIKPNDEIISLIQECKKFKFNLSIDGIGKKLEYIRYPLSWEKITSTIDYVKNLRLDNIQFVCLATINPLNIYYYNELEEWISNTFNDRELKSLVPNKSVGKVDISMMPRTLRKEIYEKYGTDHKVSKLISNVPFGDARSLVNYLNWLDTNRKTNWRNIFPEIVSHFI